MWHTKPTQHYLISPLAFLLLPNTPAISKGRQHVLSHILALADPLVWNVHHDPPKLYINLLPPPLTICFKTNTGISSIKPTSVLPELVIKKKSLIRHQWKWKPWNMGKSFVFIIIFEYSYISGTILAWQYTHEKKEPMPSRTWSSLAELKKKNCKSVFATHLIIAMFAVLKTTRMNISLSPISIEKLVKKRDDRVYFQLYMRNLQEGWNKISSHLLVPSSIPRI